MFNTTFSLSHLTRLTVIFAGMLFLFACSKDDVVISPDAMDIDTYIRGLSYNHSSLLNEHSGFSGNTNRTITDDQTTRTAPVKGKYIECTDVSYKLEKNFDKVTILRPTNGVIWPGALIYGDQDMLDGLPRPITLDRAPMTLRLDLPGMGEEGNIVVDNPSNSSVQTQINGALEWWNANEFQEGYVNPSLSEYQSTVSYSSEQSALDVGMNGEWASGSVEAQFNYTSNVQTKVAVMVFKQVFYSVTMDTPKSPGAVFGPSVSLADVQSRMDATTPPAYVSSVDYGRIIMFRMEAQDIASEINLNTVLEYASLGGSGQANAEFDKILNKSSTSITVLTIGGNAEVASEAVTASSIGSLNSILTGKNAVYGRDNPGLPIGYTIQYLKDNATAKMGYTTDYTISECSEELWDHPDIVIKNKFQSNNIRVKLVYIKNGNYTENDWQTIKDETFEGDKLDEQVPDGAYDVEMYVEKWEVNFGNIGWAEWKHYELSHVSSSESCWEAYYNGNGDKAFRKCP